MSPKPDALRTFVAVAECGTLAGASERLNRTSSAISTTLKQLETAFGGPLFDGERKSQLTALGVFALRQSRRALTHYDAATQSISQFAAGRSGRVRVAAVPSIATRLLPDVVAAFQVVAHDVALEIRAVDSLTVADQVREGQADIGLASQAKAATGVQAEMLFTEPFLVICAADHDLAQAGVPVSWDSLYGERFIAHGLLDLIGRPEVDALIGNPALTVHSIASMISFVEHNLGVTLLPAVAMPRLTSVATLPLEDASVTREVQLLTGDHLSPAAARFAELIKAYAADA